MNLLKEFDSNSDAIRFFNKSVKGCKSVSTAKIRKFRVGHDPANYQGFVRRQKGQKRVQSLQSFAG